MQYKPMHGAMRVILREPFFHRYTVVVCTDLEQLGMVKYEHLLVVLDNERNEAVFYVTSEVNEMAGLVGGGSHALCVFDDNGHANMGFSNDWADQKTFIAEAARLAREQFAPQRGG